MLEVLKAFEKVSGKALNYKVGPRREGDIEIIYADNSKARNVLGWSLKYDIKDAMVSAWKWQENLNKARSGGKVLL